MSANCLILLAGETQRLQRLRHFHALVCALLALDEQVARLIPPLKEAFRHGGLIRQKLLLLQCGGFAELAVLVEQTLRCRPRNQSHLSSHWEGRRASQRHPKMLVWHVQSDVVRPMQSGLWACGEDAGWFLQNRNGLSA